MENHPAAGLLQGLNTCHVMASSLCSAPRPAPSRSPSRVACHRKFIQLRHMFDSASLVLLATHLVPMSFLSSCCAEWPTRVCGGHISWPSHLLIYAACYCIFRVHIQGRSLSYTRVNQINLAELPGLHFCDSYASDSCFFPLTEQKREQVTKIARLIARLTPHIEDLRPFFSLQSSKTRISRNRANREPFCHAKPLPIHMLQV